MSTSNTKNAAMDTNVVHMAVRNAGLAQTASMAFLYIHACLSAHRPHLPPAAHQRTASPHSKRQPKRSRPTSPPHTPRRPPGGRAPTLDSSTAPLKSEKTGYLARTVSDASASTVKVLPARVFMVNFMTAAVVVPTRQC